ncbi:MAG: DUF6279 family lipoprotein [Lysobacterales bacterium]
MRTLKKLVVFLTVAALLAGCTSFAYNRLDWLIPWYVDGYVDLTSEQRKLLRQKLTSPLEWHREQELASYIAILDGMEADLEGKVTAGTVRGWAEELIEAAERVQTSLLMVALEFGDEVTDEQTEEFVEGLWERQRDLEEELAERSDAEYAKDDFESMKETLERFLGRLTQEQKAILRDASVKLVRFDKAWLNERRAWLEKMQNLLQREPGWREGILDAYKEREALRSPEYKAAFEHNMGLATQAYADVLNTMTDRQRQKATDEFEDLRRLLRGLMEDSS